MSKTRETRTRRRRAAQGGDRRSLWCIRGMPEDLVQQFMAVSTVTRIPQAELVVEALRPYLAKIIRQRKIGDLVGALVAARRRGAPVAKARNADKEETA